MFPISSLSIFACRLGLMALLARSALADCESFGVDFQDGGSYFQNSDSTDPFTFVQYFEGCQNDTATNLLVDPDGNQYQCSSTPLTPDDTDELSTCPLDKNQLSSGEWSILILSNNGNAAPIAYERDFSLSVGPQSTSTYTPTVTSTVVTTPVVNSTVTTTYTVTSTLPPINVTTASVTFKPTTTVTPSRVTTTVTHTCWTFTYTHHSLSVALATKTVTASCLAPTKQDHKDPTATITPTLAAAVALKSSAAKLFRRMDKFRRMEKDAGAFDMANYLEERKARLAARNLEERAPDAQPLVVTDSSTTDWITTTSTSTAPTVTLTLTTEVDTTATVTPAPVTVASGALTLSVVTITAPTPTKTHTRYVVTVTATTTTRTTTVTIKSTTTPSSVSTSCRNHGGTLQ